MNMAYSEEMIPPKELFSREWYEASTWYKAWDAASREVVHHRIDETKKKLEDLETKLRKKIWKSPYGGGGQDLLVDIITLLNSHIGVWEMRWKIMVSMPSSWKTQMAYPQRKKIGKSMSNVVLGGAQKDGVCVAMLSPECVDWLNIISDWVGE